MTIESTLLTESISQKTKENFEFSTTWTSEASLIITDGFMTSDANNQVRNSITRTLKNAKTNYYCLIE